MAGGEPFYIKNFADYVEKIVDITKDPYIEINTNATRLLPKDKNDKLQGKLNLRISIDGFEDTDNYQRTGGVEWQEKIKVIDSYYKNFHVDSFDITLSSLTIRSLPKLVEFLTGRYPNVPYILVRPILNKPGLEPNNLPIELKQEALSFCKKLERRNFYSKYQYTNITQLIDVLNKEPTNKEALKRQINFFDNVTTKKYEDIDPKIVEWVNG